MELYINKSTNNQVSKLFALAGETAAQGMLAIPQGKQNNSIKQLLSE